MKQLDVTLLKSSIDGYTKKENFNGLEVYNL